MVVPDGGSALQPADSSDADEVMSSSEPGFGPSLTAVELQEVRKLQELVRRLEVQNQALRNRGSKLVLGAAGNLSTNMNTLHGAADTSPGAEDAGKRALSPPAGCSSSEDVSPLPEASRPEDEEERAGFPSSPCASGSKQTLSCFEPSLSPDVCESETLGASDAGVDQCALDEVDELDLETCAQAEDEDSWLYVSPKKQVVAEQGPESTLKWCRKFLDHPSPETEVACRTLLHQLDQSTETSSRWKSVYSSPSQSSEAGVSLSSSAGYLKSTNKTLLTSGSSGCTGAPPALSSQSSVDSEVSTSDDSISMGYKLQDLTDVQIMARLQEESLRQDYASTSASRRSSSASLQSLRRGTYSDQELDSYSQEDEEDECCSLPQRLQCYSPRCLSPSRLASPHTRVSRCSLQGPGPRSEEELRHSMPNLTPRSSLKSLEALRNSRSMEANLQSSGNRTSRLPQSPAGVSSARMRGEGQSPLYLRAPMKALSPVSSMSAVRQAKGPVSAQRGMRRVQSPGPTNTASNSAAVARQTSGRGVTPASPSSRGRLPQTPRSRSLGMTKPCAPVADESWKDGCY
ncbi:SLAIN motif-containing protein-like isoform X1 [Cyprinus carpio]|uniref:SLAIN motif-containing protein-like isoform X1 n=1 Tax=Cyprinus carpio TaxID=7962 RepID=A0A9R0B885_CYPCA|nr:SLAIN motif-containing protein-like isoform X1 [Cyprinus carpio]XP_042625717.1 SLAIN motif-containing protein-like isoform X1 [Cyprinus carpio]